MTRAEEYFNSLSGKRVTVLGMGVSNAPLVDKLIKYGAQVTVCDKREAEALGEAAERLRSMGVETRLGAGYLEGLEADVIFRTPGMRPDLPQLVRAREAGSVITSEMEVFFELCPCRTVAVTGSDGKTTTTTLIAEMLKRAGYTVRLGGNIGKPLLPAIDEMKESDVAVAELSSFQLFTMKRSPDIAVVTNVTPNHLDVHRDMEEYVEAKRNILRWQDENGLAVLNYDNDVTRRMADIAKGRVEFFSRAGMDGDGIVISDGWIARRAAGGVEKLIKKDEILIPGEHNVENYMAAAGAVRGLVAAEQMRQVAREFGGVPHRIELVREKDGVRYYNDSIASSPARTTAGLRSFNQKLILIAGGYDKHIPFEPLAPEICDRVKTLVLVGATAEKIKKAVTGCEKYREGAPEIIMAGGFEEAVRGAAAAARSGDVVILSPACASFDLFKNFEKRGEAFRDIVNSL